MRGVLIGCQAPSGKTPEWGEASSPLAVGYLWIIKGINQTIGQNISFVIHIPYGQKWYRNVKTAISHQSLLGVCHCKNAVFYLLRQSGSLPAHSLWHESDKKPTLLVLILSVPDKMCSGYFYYTECLSVCLSACLSDSLLCSLSVSVFPTLSHSFSMSNYGYCSDFGVDVWTFFL